MGIPIDHSFSSPPTNFTPGHSAKPSWSNGTSVSNVSSNSQLSTSRINRDNSNSPSSFSYIPPPPSNWGYSARSPRLTHSPHSISSPPSPPSPPPHSYSPDFPSSQERHHHRQNSHLELSDHSENSSVVSGFTDIEIESPLPTWARSHPNIRRIGRAPALSSHSPSGADNWDLSSPSLPSVPRTYLASSSSSSPSDIGNYTSGWDSNLTSTREYYLTRPLPIPPTRIPHSSSSSSSSSSALPSGQYLQGREQTDAINMNSYGANGYFYEDHRLRHEQQILLQQPPSYQQRQRLYHSQPYDPSVHSTSSYLSESQARGRAGNRYRDMEMQIVTMSTSSASSSSSSLPSLSPSSAQSPLTTVAVPSFLQGATGSSRTIVRAHPFRPGMIRIYPENHEPITMYGRPIITPTSPSPTNYGHDPIRNQNNQSNNNNITATISGGSGNSGQALEIPSFSEMSNISQTPSPPTSASSTISTITLGSITPSSPDSSVLPPASTSPSGFISDSQTGL